MADFDFSTIILRTEHPALRAGRDGDIKLLGKTAQAWVAAAAGAACVVIDGPEAGETENIADLVRNYLTDSEYTVVLYSDTPLATRRTVLEAVALCAGRKLNVCRLARGFVFKTDFLRDVPKILSAERFYLSSEEDFIVVSDFKQAAFAAGILRLRINDYHMARGVYIVDPAATTIEGGVTIGEGVTIHPGNQLLGETRVGAGVTLYRDNTLIDCEIGAGCALTSSVVTESGIGERTTVGPFAYIRLGSLIGADCRIGDFVEIKKSRVGDGTKISHLAYVGDAEVGRNCNIGCGAVFANYDGKNKNKTVVGDNVFVGSNCNLIAPLKIGDGAFLAAGSTITDAVGKGLAIARARQVNKPDWKRN